MPKRSNDTQAKTFRRDVLINVLANLIAAAIIYILGALAGLFPKNPELFGTAVATLLFATGFAVMKRGETRDAAGRLTSLGTGFLLLGSALVVGCIAGADRLNWHTPAALEDKFWGAVGVGALVTGVRWLRQAARVRQGEAAEASAPRQHPGTGVPVALPTRRRTVREPRIAMTRRRRTRTLR